MIARSEADTKSLALEVVCLIGCFLDCTDRPTLLPLVQNR